MTRVSSGQGREDLLYRRVGEVTHLLVGPILDRVGDIDSGKAYPEGLHLGGGGVDELGGRDEHAG